MHQITSAKGWLIHISSAGTFDRTALDDALPWQWFGKSCHLHVFSSQTNMLERFYIRESMCKIRYLWNDNDSRGVLVKLRSSTNNLGVWGFCVISSTALFWTETSDVSIGILMHFLKLLLPLGPLRTLPSTSLSFVPSHLVLIHFLALLLTDVSWGCHI